jgi:hypothetical protein
MAAMQRKAFEEAIRTLAAEAGFRKISRGQHRGEIWLGVHSGIFIVLELDAVRLQATFTSPESKEAASEEAANSNDASDVEKKPVTEAFRRTAQLGIRADWFDQTVVGPWGFVLYIDEARRNELGRNDLNGFLDFVAADLHDLGAENSKPCSECPEPATKLAYIESLGEQPLVAPYCDHCWESLQKTTRGVVKKAAPKNELGAYAVLALGVVTMTAIWGYAQHPELGVPILFLNFGCGVAGAGLAAITMVAANGSNWRLRLCVVTGVLLATLVGNMIGLKLFADSKQMPLPWMQVAPAYLFKYLPLNYARESLYYIGGVIGVLIAFYIMRESERMRVR